MNKDGEALRLAIDGVTSQGEGVGRSGFGAVFVAGALPGEVVLARLKQKKKSFARAELIQVLEASPDRVTPPCPYFGLCGGCGLQHAAYPAQLALKQQIVAQTLGRIAGLATEIPLPLGAEQPYGYRCRAMLHGAWGEAGLDFGFYQPASHQLVPADQCLLLAEPLRDLIALLRQALPDFEPGLAGLREIAVRCSSDRQRLLLTLVGAHRLPGAGKLAEALLAAEPRLVAVWENSGPAEYGAYGGNWQLLGGEEDLLDELAGIRLAVAPAAFTQVHPAQAARLYQVAGAFAQADETAELLDLYCGLGGVGLALAGPKTRLTGVESYAPAVAAAKRNALLNAKEDALFYMGKAEDVLPRLAAAGIAPQVAVLDPPRSGCEEGALAALIRLSPQRIVYISCAPATLARDLKYLFAAGYGLAQAQPVDMFCQTAHVETCVLMSRE